MSKQAPRVKTLSFTHTDLLTTFFGLCHAYAQMSLPGALTLMVVRHA